MKLLLKLVRLLSQFDLWSRCKEFTALMNHTPSCDPDPEPEPEQVIRCSCTLDTDPKKQLEQLFSDNFLDIKSYIYFACFNSI